MITERIRPFMRPDHHSGDRQYPLVSLYLDSEDLRLCRESLDGLKNRYKLRIRSYSDDPDAVCFFEIKRRINQVIVKSRARVMRRDVGSILEHEAGRCLGNEEDRRNLDQFLFYRRQIHAEPVVRVRYARQAL